MLFFNNVFLIFRDRANFLQFIYIEELFFQSYIVIGLEPKY